MKNKKTIAITTAAMSLASVVPAFANPTPAINFDSVVSTLDYNGVRGTKLADGDGVATNGIHAFTREDADLYLKRNKDAKIVGSKRIESQPNKSMYIVQDKDSSLNAANMAYYKEELAKIENLIKRAGDATYTSNGNTHKRYTIGVTRTNYSVAADNKVVPSTLVYHIRDNVKPNNTKTITLQNVDTDYEIEAEIEVKSIRINRVGDGVELELNKALYELTKALKNSNGKLMYKTVSNGSGQTIEIWDDAQLVKYGEIITNMDIPTLSSVYKKVPVSNDFIGHWGEDEIVEQMILGGIPTSSTYIPNKKITRGEFANLLYKNYTARINTVAGTQQKPNEFIDVAKNTYYSKAVEKLAAAGYINGYGDGTFKPNSPITREEAAKILERVLGNEGDTIIGTDANGNPIHKDIVTRFDDDKDISVWADESVESLHDNNILKGYEDHTFKPKGNITRAEAAAIVNRSL